MSVRQGMLALLAEEPMHCYHLRQRFEDRTGGTWPLNIGQAYTTVQRLVRDELVEVVPAADSVPGTSSADDDVPGAPSDDDAPGTRTSGRTAGTATHTQAPQHVERYRLTAAGHAEVAQWWITPVVRGNPARDELAIKLALAVTAPGVDVRAVVQSQRTETMRALRDYTRLAAEQGSELTWALVLDNLVFTTEAEIRWLDHVEARISRATASAAKEPRATATREAGPQEGSTSPRPVAATSSTTSSTTSNDVSNSSSTATSTR